MIKFFIKGFRVNALLTILSRITGFIRDIVLAFFLGAGIASDIFLFHLNYQTCLEELQQKVQ